MNRVGLLLVFALVIATCFGQNNSVVITKTSFARITRNTGFETLKKLFGATNVKDAETYGPEGIDTIPVTFIYPGTKKQLTVYWREGEWHKTVSSVECTAAGAPYYTSHGIRIGSALEKVLQANAKKLTFSGIGWDYGGYVGNYHKGKLESWNLQIRLTGKPSVSQEMYGDTSPNTDMPSVKKNLTRLLVSSIALVF